MYREECFGASGRSMTVSLSKARQDDPALKALHFCAFSDICLCPVLVTDENKPAVRNGRSLCQLLFLINRIDISVYDLVRRP